MDLSVDHAIVTVGELARDLGFPSVPHVLADRSNLVLRLEGEGCPTERVVARVAMATSLVRVGMDWLRREVDVSGFLDARGVPVTRPSARLPSGPHERDGLVISFWELEELTGTVDPLEAGRRLRAAHVALATYPNPEGVPEWGAVREAREVDARARRFGVFDRAEALRIDRAWERAEAILATVPRRTASHQVVHGDAHLRNVLATRRGTLWTDWEDAFVGPVEWDLACMQSRAVLLGEEREAIALAVQGYGDVVDAELVRELALLRNLQVIPWLAVFSERDPSLLARMRDRMDRLP